MAGIGDVFTGIGDLAGKLVGVFDNGVDIYAGIQNRIEALKLIKGETPEPNQAVVSAPSPSQEKSAQAKASQGLNNVSLLLITAGALGAILLVIALKRK